MAMSLPSYADEAFRQTFDLDDPWSRASLAADVDSVGRSSRSLLQVGTLHSDLASWKQRANESVRQASLRSIHLQGKLHSSVDSEKSRSSIIHRATMIQQELEPEPILEEERDSTTVPVVAHSGWLIKRAHRTRSFKRRLFCILGRELVYHKSYESSTANAGAHSGVSGKVNLALETVVQPVPNHGFKLLQGASTSMLLYALNDVDRDTWVAKLQMCGATLNVVAADAKPMDDKVIASGWLRKQGQFFKSVKRRWFELTGVGLKYYRNPDATSARGFVAIGRRSAVARLDMRKTGERFSLRITENASEKKTRVLIVHADSQEDRDVWAAALASVIDGHEPIEAALPSPLDSSYLERSISEEASPTHEGSFVSLAPPHEDDVVREITREAQLILVSPYSPEGTTSENFLKTIHRKTLSLDAIRRFMEGLMEYMVETRMDEFRAIYGNDDDDDASSSSKSASFDVIAQIISEQVEERVFSPIHKVVYQSLVTRLDSKALHDRLELLRARKQAYFGIQPPSPSGYAAAIDAMNAIESCSLPTSKRKQLVAACKAIYAVAADEQLYPGCAMSADDFIPAFIYVVVQCAVEDVLTLKELLVAFPPVSDTGETAYFVTCLEIAIEYVQSLVILQEIELDNDRALGLEFGVHDHVLLVDRVSDQAEASGAVHVGDVLMTINGLCVHDRDAADVHKILDGAMGPIALAFVNVKDYKKLKAKLSRDSI
ncbi:Aste57867_24665 [Aphanomyces stellatus]|uniref:Aste57867_24665 protein n=1 Tax=Aphanomyces stellatus TaxID=120398 RepID=A0A485LR10_9STRA|nr:hypothetical protein As57867_024587 [Aphanomyces stellatus]VFU01302.1 Aste57867_24665 [Aphanomyces stellatus]